MTNKGGNVHTFDIWGCCVSRDSFGIPADHGKGICFSSKANIEEDWPNDSEFRYQIRKYIRDCSLTSQLSPKHGPELEEEDINSEKFIKLEKSWLCSDYNKDVFQKLQESGSEWLILDFRVETYGKSQVLNNNGTIDYVSRNNDKDRIETLRSLPWIKDVIPIPTDLSIDKKNVKKLSDFVKKRYGEKIILIEVREAFYNLTPKGETIDSPADELAVYIESAYNSLFLENTGCYYIKSPYNICRDALHKWNPNSAHYLSEYYDYVYDSIRTIVSSPKEEIRKKLDLLYAGICAKIASIRIQHSYSLDNTLKRAKINLECGKIDQAIKLYEDLIKQNEPMAYLRMGQVYADKKYGKYDLNTAAKWVRRAVDQGVESGRVVLFDILWKIGTPDAYAEMISVVKTFAEAGDANAMGRMGRAYRDGKGVEQNLNIAAEWMRKSSNLGTNWTKNELFDILWKIGTPDAYDEMVSVIKTFAEAGDANAMGRLGKSYHRGRGVERNLSTASYWMRKAAEKGVGWAKNELFDILWQIGTPEAYNEMISVAKTFAEAGDANAMGRMGRAYRDGKGVEQNRELAAKWMKAAAEKGASWAKKELDQLSLLS